MSCWTSEQEWVIERVNRSELLNKWKKVSYWQSEQEWVTEQVNKSELLKEITKISYWTSEQEWVMERMNKSDLANNTNRSNLLQATLIILSFWLHKFNRLFVILYMFTCSYFLLLTLILIVLVKWSEYVTKLCAYGKKTCNFAHRKFLNKLSLKMAETTLAQSMVPSRIVLLLT